MVQHFDGTALPPLGGSSSENLYGRLRNLEAAEKKIALERLAIREELKKLKERLPDDWKDKLVEKYPHLNRIDTGEKISRVLNGRSFDVDLVAAIESVCETEKTRV